MDAQLGAQVDALVRETAATVVLPSYRHLQASEISEKGPGEVVTVADRRSEEVLTAGLLDLLPRSVVVGEEAYAADSALLGRLGGDAPTWIVDPIDGTANYASGSGPFCLMVALLDKTGLVASWIYDPVDDLMGHAVAGQGAFLDGARVEPAPPLPADQLRGVAPATYYPADLKAKVERGQSRLGEVSAGQRCAGREYLDLVAGGQQFTMFWRTWPWDHAPGALLVREAGGVVRRLDGADYAVTPEPGQGLLAAIDESTWDTVASALIP
ncbi:inositol monophosphatase family protein [Asanoa sp. WMMD1127]|uniref:inositol monophosphatase family protein n=1 Tax=Asanoa sp. WMMD1127 TaxID=3016107 RepID=UPI00241666E4|nr:inositol monophosphatase family protein [Asanoa sp. WMMD1127]MDG4821328.1 inositol monophosphatase family protein [Asanoa sp. WMMD1127]